MKHWEEKIMTEIWIALIEILLFCFIISIITKEKYSFTKVKSTLH